MEQGGDLLLQSADRDLLNHCTFSWCYDTFNGPVDTMICETLMLFVKFSLHFCRRIVVSVCVKRDSLMRFCMQFLQVLFALMFLTLSFGHSSTNGEQSATISQWGLIKISLCGMLLYDCAIGGYFYLGSAPNSLSTGAPLNTLLGSACRSPDPLMSEWEREVVR